MSFEKTDRDKGIFHFRGQAHRPLGVRMLLKAWLSPLFLRRGGVMNLGEWVCGRFDEIVETLGDYGLHIEERETNMADKIRRGYGACNDDTDIYND